MTDRLLIFAGDLFGDGVFETIHLRPAGPWLLDEHLARLARSAELLELTLPPTASIRARVLAAELPAAEAALRIIATRTDVHVTVSEMPATVLRERRDGIKLISADLGHAVGRRPPWDLAAAKSLSYASNFAARRWARRQGADDVVWLSSDGYALESPTASLVWLTGDTLCTVPPAEAGILAGTTAAHLLSLAPALGLRADERMVTLAGLAAADTIWLASSLRGLAVATSLDGAPRPPSPWTERLLSALGF